VILNKSVFAELRIGNLVIEGLPILRVLVLLEGRG